ncbi:hypothetical protein FA13DRAFT_1455698 [Coprinellus micaceus]|uniref:Uncharacterized protein n=1 Tax=Coprinellus micaceus TaxID=71717 RepID=A0A4Y7SMM9_COPMI|nr:hypothetical protein FA13DRAFT_1455698 [Coprinellus micaceus]
MRALKALPLSSNHVLKARGSLKATLRSKEIELGDVKRELEALESDVCTLEEEVGRKRRQRGAGEFLAPALLHTSTTLSTFSHVWYRLLCLPPLFLRGFFSSVVTSVVSIVISFALRVVTIVVSLPSPSLCSP